MAYTRFENPDETQEILEFYNGSKSENGLKKHRTVHKKSMCEQFKLTFFGRPKSMEGPPCYQETRKYYPGKA